MDKIGPEGFDVKIEAKLWTEVDEENGVQVELGRVGQEAVEVLQVQIFSSAFYIIIPYLDWLTTEILKNLQMCIQIQYYFVF